MKRGTTELSLLVGVNKPAGMTSHDVVNRARRIFGERRVGHTGTLDPLAQGVLPVTVGPATRLERYLVGHDKTYRATITLGIETNTDDSDGEVTAKAPVPAEASDATFARSVLKSTEGIVAQTPPRYSAIKINGKSAYKLARAGVEVKIEPRFVRVYAADLVAIGQDGAGNPTWTVDYTVSKGTYIRTLAHDLGRMLGTYAHMSGLLRTKSGRIPLESCVTIESLEHLKEQAALDPVRVLGFRYAFADNLADKIANGSFIDPADVTVFVPLDEPGTEQICSCTSSICPSPDPLAADEDICIVVENKLKAIYSYNESTGVLKPACVFSIGVTRG